jgi:hypothetical protein
VDPVGFEPTIFSVQGRRLPTRPRAPVRPDADERTRTSTPLRAIDPKSIASANSATSAHFTIVGEINIYCKFWRNRTPDSVDRAPCRPMQRPYCHLSRQSPARRIMACWALPNFTRSAATRSHHYSSMTLSPCSQPHARLAEYIAVPAGRLLPYPFTPYHANSRRDCSLLRL